MSKKNTYAAMMKQLTNKKAQYEKGLEDARRTNNRSGVADYERRLTRLNAGMDELFQAQEMSKAPQAGAQFAYGGMTKNRYDDGGLTPGATNQLLPGSPAIPKDNRTPGMWGSGYSLIPWDGRPNALVDDNGNMVLANYKDGHYVMTPNLWKLRATNPAQFNKAMENPDTGVGQFKFKPEEYKLGSFGENGKFMPSADNADAMAAASAQNTAASIAGGGTAETAAPMQTAPVQTTPERPAPSVGGMGDLEFMQAMDETMRNETQDVGNGIMFGSSVGPAATPATPVGASAVGPTAASTPAAAPSTTGTTATAPEFEVIPTLAGRSASQVLNTAKGDMYYPGGAPLGLQGDVTGGVEVDPTIPTKSHGLGDLKNRAANTFGNLGNSGLGMIAGAAAQFVPDLIAKNRMKQIQGPVAAPQMRYAAGLTDIDTGRAIAAVRNQTAQANAAVDQSFANPQVAAAMKRANMNAAQANLGNILSQEASQEMQLRNQELQRGTDVSNQNRMISAQNLQAQRDFDNQRIAAMNRMDMQMGQKLGGLYTDFQNRAQDRAKWDMYSKIFNEDMLKRQGIDPTA